MTDTTQNQLKSEKSASSFSKTDLVEPPKEEKTNSTWAVESQANARWTKTCHCTKGGAEVGVAQFAHRLSAGTFLFAALCVLFCDGQRSVPKMMVDATKALLGMAAGMAEDAANNGYLNA